MVKRFSVGARLTTSWMRHLRSCSAARNMQMYSGSP